MPTGNVNIPITYRQICYLAGLPITCYEQILRFVDSLPMNDKWVDEFQGLISELKTDEIEKANYMTYQMKIAEERSEAKAEGRKEGEGRLALFAPQKWISSRGYRSF